MKNKQIFVDYAKSFFERNGLKYEFRDNLDGKYTFLSNDGVYLLYYSSDTDLSININFDDIIIYEIRYKDTIIIKTSYNMNVFLSKMDMVLDYINNIERLFMLKEELIKSDINIKRKTKQILNKLDEIST